MKALVTGGGGFLGSAVVRQLAARGDDVRILARSSYPELVAAGVQAHRGDVGDPAAVRTAVAGCDVVFHVAARAGVAGRPAQFAATNVEGTRTVVEACRALGVPRLVHTSTPSVVASRAGVSGGDESLPYSRRYSAPYPATKAVAERIVRAANGPGLGTVALRPHLIWGPGDTQLVPRILDRARRGRLRFVGDGNNLVDSTYVEDAAAAHLAAADRLEPGAAIGGRVYFISQGEPLPIRDLVNRILAAAGLAPVHATISLPVAYAVGAVAEAAYGLIGHGEPPMTRFLARQLATPHWFDIGAARRDLGYVPTITIGTGMLRLGEHLRRSGQHGGRSGRDG